MNTLEPTMFLFIGYLFICWFAGFTLGIIFRFLRQVFEKASRT